MSKERLNGKEPWVAQSFLFFYVINFSVSGWLIQGNDTSKKGMTGFLGHLYILECHCLLSILEANSSSNGKRGLLRLSAFPLKNMHNALTLYSLEFPRFVGPLQFYTHGASHILHADGCQGMVDTHVYIALLRHMFHCLTRLNFQKPSSETKLLRIS